MSQSHLVIDFPIKGPAERQGATRRAAPVDARSREERRTTSVPCISPVSWSRETRSFSSFRTLTARSTSISSGSWRAPARCLTPSSSTWTTLQPRPWLITLRGSIKWLKRHVREPLDTYFAYEDASVQEIKACARAAGFTGKTSQAPLLTYMSIKSRLQGFALKQAAKSIRRQGL